MIRLLLVALSMAFLVPSAALAASATQVFQRSSKSVVVVLALDGAGQTRATGSGVVTGKDEVVTNCHVLRGSSKVVILHNKKKHAASITAEDQDKDLCRLIVPNLRAPAANIVPLSSISVGAKVYAIGAPRGLELSLSDGLISSIRNRKGIKVIQTTTPISPGSSGGGLFDSQGALVGITTFYLENSQNLNFAIPAEYLAGLESTAAPELAMDEAAWQERAWDQLIEHGGLLTRPVEALRYAQAWSQREAENPIVWNILSSDYLANDLPEKAAEAAKRSISMLPTVRGFVALGNAQRRLGDHANARKTYENALAIDPENSRAWSGLGATYLVADNYLAGDNYTAIKHLRRAYDLSGQGATNIDGLITLCVMYSFTKMHKEYEECVERKRVILEPLEKAFK